MQTTRFTIKGEPGKVVLAIGSHPETVRAISELRDEMERVFRRFANVFATAMNVEFALELEGELALNTDQVKLMFLDPATPEAIAASTRLSQEQFQSLREAQRRLESKLG